MDEEEKNDPTESVGLSTDIINKMSRAELVDYLVESFGDEIDPEEIRQMSDEKVNEFKILLQNSIAHGQSEDKEKEMDDGDDDDIIFLEQVKKTDDDKTNPVVNVVPTEIQRKEDNNLAVNSNILNTEDDVTKVISSIIEPGTTSSISKTDQINWDILAKINFDSLSDSRSVQSFSSSTLKPTQAVTPQVKRPQLSHSPEQVKVTFFDPSFNLPIKPNHLVVYSRKLWLNHLPTSVDEVQIARMFEPFGNIESVTRTRSRRRFAHVTMNRRVDAVRSMENLQNVKLNGESVLIAWSPPSKLKNSEWMNFWNANNGVFYIPWTILCADTPVDIFQEEGTIDKSTLPFLPSQDDGVQRIRRRRLSRDDSPKNDDKLPGLVRDKGGVWYSGDQEPPCVQGSSNNNNNSWDVQNQLWTLPQSSAANDNGQGAGTSWSWSFQPIVNVNNNNPFNVQNNSASSDNPFCLQNAQFNPFCYPQNPQSVNPFCVQNVHGSVNNNYP